MTEFTCTFRTALKMSLFNKKVSILWLSFLQVRAHSVINKWVFCYHNCHYQRYHYYYNYELLVLYISFPTGSWRASVEGRQTTLLFRLTGHIPKITEMKKNSIILRTREQHWNNHAHTSTKSYTEFWRVSFLQRQQPTTPNQFWFSAIVCEALLS